MLHNKHNSSGVLPSKLIAAPKSKAERLLNTKERDRYLRQEYPEDDVEMQEEFSSGGDKRYAREAPQQQMALQEELEEIAKRKRKAAFNEPTPSAQPRSSLREFLFSQGKDSISQPEGTLYSPPSAAGREGGRADEGGLAFGAGHKTPLFPKYSPRGAASSAEMRLREALRSAEVVLAKLRNENWATRVEALEKTAQWLADPALQDHP